ncbi:hypothetical protein Y1Q_0023301 [Alligator mississippiensis]|uniref:Uncharacterized protein n=1 Tax=Alligator mississippiensis TaxID=8496 RepID=A0A151NP49_ALLMI|nr:hypothetical protein Y1Q_0023301 [Alligator mississippiensis]
MGRGSPAPFLLGLVAKTSVKMKIFFSVLNKHLLRQSGIYRNDEGPTSGHRREAAGPCMSAAAGSPPPATRAA